MLFAGITMQCTSSSTWYVLLRFITFHTGVTNMSLVYDATSQDLHEAQTARATIKATVTPKSLYYRLRRDVFLRLPLAALFSRHMWSRRSMEWERGGLRHYRAKCDGGEKSRLSPKMSAILAYNTLLLGTLVSQACRVYGGVTLAYATSL